MLHFFLLVREKHQPFLRQLPIDIVDVDRASNAIRQIGLGGGGTAVVHPSPSAGTGPASPPPSRVTYVSYFARLPTERHSHYTPIATPSSSIRSTRPPLLSAAGVLCSYRLVRARCVILSLWWLVTSPCPLSCPPGPQVYDQKASKRASRPTELASTQCPR
jgi:hypothetical protein